MLLYEVTIQVNNLDIENKFYNFMNEKHVQDVINTGCFKSAIFCKLNNIGSYRASYLALQKEDLDLYLEKFAPALREDFLNLFPNNEISSTRSILDGNYFQTKTI